MRDSGSREASWLGLFDVLHLEHICQSLERGMAGLSFNDPETLALLLRRDVVGPVAQYLEDHFMDGVQEVQMIHTRAGAEFGQYVETLCESLDANELFPEERAREVVRILRTLWIEFIAMHAGPSIAAAPYAMREKMKRIAQGPRKAKDLTTEVLAAHFDKCVKGSTRKGLISDLETLYGIGARSVEKRFAEAKRRKLFKVWVVPTRKRRGTK